MSTSLSSPSHTSRPNHCAFHPAPLSPGPCWGVHWPPSRVSGRNSLTTRQYLGGLGSCGREYVTKTCPD
ncbi:hypothetical protein E2C01_021460 [Portunus trituberculatus]|uniref:Uncharacterized protein n=1 Tax=Portunus trituberculatus TaxID=210409 RepID=A0A5B7E2N6_PORTR|nr:hypothetical protein [Portunus trituberculatus]